MRAVLAAPIRVVNQSLSRAFGRHSIEQGLVNQIPGQAFPHGISNNISGKEILVGGNIQPAFVSRHVGYITHPYLVRHGNLELLPQDILGYREGMLRIGGSFEFPLLLTAYTELSSNTFDPANSYPNTVLR